jgi:tetratricopeptide (TPR) repeat protein
MAIEQKEGRWHPSLIYILKDMSSACQQQGNYAQAEQHMKHLLMIQDQLLTSDAPSTIRAAAAENLAAFAMLLDLQDKIAESESHHTQVIETREASLGATHEGTLKAVENLGVNYRNQKKYSKAISTYQDVLERRLNGPDRRSSQVMGTATKLADVFEKIGKRAEAEKLRAYWRRRAALRGCWPDPETNLAEELQPITPKTKFGTRKRCWAVNSTGTVFPKFEEIRPLLEEVLNVVFEANRGKKPAVPKVSYTCCMVGFSPDAVRPAVVLHCAQSAVCRAAEDRLASSPRWKERSEANPMFLLLVAMGSLKALSGASEES